MDHAKMKKSQQAPYYNLGASERRPKVVGAPFGPMQESRKQRMNMVR
jgi:hypothetical protein